MFHFTCWNWIGSISTNSPVSEKPANGARKASSAIPISYANPGQMASYAADGTDPRAHGSVLVLRRHPGTSAQAGQHRCDNCTEYVFLHCIESARTYLIIPREPRCSSKCVPARRAAQHSTFDVRASGATP